VYALFIKPWLALLTGLWKAVLGLPPVTAARDWWRGLKWDRRQAWRRRWVKAWPWGAWILGLAIAWLALHWIGLWGWIGDLIGLTGAAFRSVQDTGFADMEADKQVEALRNLLWGLSVAAGTLGALVAMGFAAWRTWNDARRTATERRKLETETFAKAIEQLGNDDFAIRLGAILNLETLAKSSPRLHPVIMEAFCAYIREKRPTPEPLLGEADAEAPDEDAPWQERVAAAKARVEKIRNAVSELPPFPNDLQAIVTALGRRTVAYDRPGSRLDLRGADLRKADLSGGHFEGADLRGAHLEGAVLREAHLEGSDLSDAHLEASDLREAHLQAGILQAANLLVADLWRTKLTRGTFFAVNLEHASLVEAYLENSNFALARFHGAELDEAHVKGARVPGADLRNTDVTQKQLGIALGDAYTKIPDHLNRPAHWTKPPPADAAAPGSDPEPPAQPGS